MWLIRLTGDPNRQANIHVDFAAEAKVKRFAFDQFTLPACGACNAAFATMEARLILATLARRHRLSLAPGQRVVARPQITLGPKNGIRMKISSRRSSLG